jgi:hypothetical protein
VIVGLIAGHDPVAVQAEGQSPALRPAADSNDGSPQLDRGGMMTAERGLSPHAQTRLANDLQAVRSFRPGYAFWQHVFANPDGSIAFGSAVDGRLLALLPIRGDWSHPAAWKEPSLASTLSGQRLPVRLRDRRETLARLLEAETGPVVHNPTRGLLLLPNIDRYAGFLDEWGAIYERFGVPAEIGLAQALVESGLNPTIRSEARAVGFCQWLAGNWRRLQRLAPNIIEGHNQTTQAPYCAAYLTILATKYGSFIPALSEHHTGGTNVGRVVINGARLGGQSIREQYFLGAAFSRDLRADRSRVYRDVYGSYGPRSFLYSEMVFGNTLNIARLRATVPQTRIHAMRVPRTLTLEEITGESRLAANEVRRYNPALRRAVPRGANLYLPRYVESFGPDTSFWHRPPSDRYSMILRDLLSLDATPEQWDDPSFEPVLRDYERRFKETDTEEGSVMATLFAYVRDDLYTSRRGTILSEFRTSDRLLRLFDRAVLARRRSGDSRPTSDSLDH